MLNEKKLTTNSVLIQENNIKKKDKQQEKDQPSDSNDYRPNVAAALRGSDFEDIDQDNTHISAEGCGRSRRIMGGGGWKSLQR